MDNTLNTSESSKSAAAPVKDNGGGGQRRSSRVTIAIPVVVYGRGPDQQIFVEEVTTTVVNAHGGKFTIRAALGRQEVVVLKNPRTGVEAKCRTVSLKDSSPGQHEAGVEFVEPAPRFWGIAFPPADWIKSERRLPPDPNKRAH